MEASQAERELRGSSTQDQFTGNAIPAAYSISSATMRRISTSLMSRLRHWQATDVSLHLRVKSAELPGTLRHV